MTRLRLTADDPAVWTRTLAAVTAHQNTRRVTIRCAGKDGRCGTRLAVVTESTWGPLFVSTWSTASRLPIETYVDSVRQSRRAVIAELTHASGPEEDWREADGCIALLTLPTGLTQDVPDLMVRCSKCGDAVIDPSDALGWLRTHTGTVVVTTTLPRQSYRYGRALTFTSTSRSHYQTHHGTAAMTLDEADEWLGWNSSPQED